MKFMATLVNLNVPTVLNPDVLVAKQQELFRLLGEMKQVIIAYKGACAVTLNAPGDEVDLPLGAWDTVSVPAGAWRSIRNTGDIDCEMTVITAGDGRKTPEWAPEVVEAAMARGHSVADAASRMNQENMR